MNSINPTFVRLSLFTVWCTAFYLMSDEPVALFLDYAGFALLGVAGAVFANATGAGGGVIFVPFFSQLGLDNITIVATSFAIQCFGMTAGAISWYLWFRKHQNSNPEWQPVHRVLWWTVPFSIAGIVFVQITGFESPNSLHATFGAFSVFLAIAIFASIPLLKKQSFNSHLTRIDYLLLPLISVVGGGITAWLSVGVGELIAIYLIFRRFNVSFAIACAVILSAFSVWFGVLYHVFDTQSVYWSVVIFAGLGAAVGGTLARHLALYFSVTHLKVFFAAWVLLIGIASMPL
ncbi:sulfite exporter TauE/SafE family protein [Planctobacterium marinum]|uniref:sulfite exporter TauE/SafE family protein n=1 Tax=Planctobacterium marinum TaxID=1631968 RepID=UPI001E58C613|nr:sulfite exporter TauE/SafE family protein [Planctobacterium marinum]MCC2607375.1 sulfite exporter TauE/SafE family protein [Planctobacterium marinum]